ncbi:MAG: hypothetical protein IJN04_01250 [Clostridia bacterium]|nr:hypothetical protein [Clostridia bacterium]
MKKPLGFSVVVLCLCLLLSACSAAAYDNPTPAPDAEDNGFISEEEAIAVAEQHFGIKNGSVDDKTGYPMAYRVTQSPTAELPIYKVALQWQVTVDGEASHWSTLDTVEIEAVHGGIRIL